MITGFIDVFREEFEKINFPIEVSSIRMANDPLKAVSRGCMTAAIEETRALTEVDVQVAPATLERTVAHVSKVDEGTKRRLGPIHTPRPAALMTDRTVPTRVAPTAPPPSRGVPEPSVKVVKTEPIAPPAIVRGRDEGIKVLKVAPPPAPPAAPAKKDTSVRVAPKPFSSNPPPPPPPPPPPKKKEAELELVEVEEIQDLTPEPKQKGDDIEDMPLIS
jgi:hypothetical protein